MAARRRLVLGGVRAIQFTPPGSGCSIHFSTNQAAAPPGSAQRLFLIVSDLDAARDELAQRGAEVGEVYAEYMVSEQAGAELPK